MGNVKGKFDVLYGCALCWRSTASVRQTSNAYLCPTKDFKMAKLIYSALAMVTWF